MKIEVALEAVVRSTAHTGRGDQKTVLKISHLGFLGKARQCCPDLPRAGVREGEIPR
jgi:hypothetical protein